MKKLSVEKKVGVFKALASKSLVEVGVDFGFDKYFDNKNQISTFVYKIYQEVKNESEKFGITQEALDIVQQGMDARKAKPNKSRIESALTKDEKELIEEGDIEALINVGTKKGGLLLHKKMDQLMKRPKLLERTSISQIATAFAILFDKTRILKGEATEHIAVKAKIDDNMSPDEAIDMIIKKREEHIDGR